MKTQFALDTETTGLKSKEGDRIIEIAIVEITRSPTPKIYNQFFNPGDREVDPEAFRVHGISNQQLKDKPYFEDCISDILNFIGDDSELIIHNAPFDLEFLRDEFNLAGQIWPEPAVIDTLKLANRKWPHARNNLDALCNRFGIDISARAKHGGLIDTQLLANMYLAWFGQGGLNLEAKTPLVQREELASLGALNTLMVKFNQPAVTDTPPSKSWDEVLKDYQF